MRSRMCVCVCVFTANNQKTTTMTVEKKNFNIVLKKKPSATIPYIHKHVYAIDGRPLFVFYYYTTIL